MRTSTLIAKWPSGYGGGGIAVGSVAGRCVDDYFQRICKFDGYYAPPLR